MQGLLQAVVWQGGCRTRCLLSGGSRTEALKVFYTCHPGQKGDTRLNTNKVRMGAHNQHGVCLQLEGVCQQGGNRVQGSWSVSGVLCAPKRLQASALASNRKHGEGPTSPITISICVWDLSLHQEVENVSYEVSEGTADLAHIRYV